MSDDMAPEREPPDAGAILTRLRWIRIQSGATLEVNS